jgi:hypothetical protein
MRPSVCLFVCSSVCERAHTCRSVYSLSLSFCAANSEDGWARRASHRTFGPAEWGQLAERLQTWRTSVDGVLEVVRNAKLLTDAAPASLPA